VGLIGGIYLSIIMIDNNLSLRSPKLSDFDYYRDWWSDSNANYLDNGNYDDIPDDKVLKKLEKLILSGNLQGWFTICVDNTPIGYLSYRNVNYIRQDAEVAIRIGRAYWSKGYGLRAINLLKNHIIDDLRLDSVWLEVFEYNAGAIRLYIKAGFLYEDERIDKGRKIIKMRYTPK
jgi:RimJ/RimL family protein N-acetyltransferase